MPKSSAEDFEARLVRLSDRILYALELALEQEDLEVSEKLARALELAVTRDTGGEEFVERRDFPPEIAKALDQLAVLKKKG